MNTCKANQCFLIIKPIGTEHLFKMRYLPTNKHIPLNLHSLFESMFSLFNVVTALIWAVVRIFASVELLNLIVICNENNKSSHHGSRLCR